MTRALLRAGACALLAALLGAAWLTLFYAVKPALVVDFDRGTLPQISGFYPEERDDATGLTFAWTTQEAVIRLPGLDRRVTWILDVRARGARADPRENPELAIAADGIFIQHWQPPTDFGDVRIEIPPHPAGRRGAEITMRASRTFTPGPADPRPLGVMVDRISLRPAGIVLPPRAAFAGAALSAALLAAAVALIGVTAPAAVMAAVILSAAASALISQGFAPFTPFPWTAVTASFWIALILVAAARAVQWFHGEPLRNTARFALAFSTFAAFIKLLVLLHPDMPVGDAMFHAHRFRNVVGGNLFFTSVAPGNYQFPYAPGLYVAAAPFADYVTRNTGDMALLRIFVVAFDAVAAALLYLMTVRAWANRRAAAIAVGLYHLIPLGFGVATVGNLTNAFAQSLAVFSLAAIVSPSLRLERLPGLAGTSLLIAAAFMSHTSTFAILAPATLLIAALYLWKGGPALRSPAAAVAVACALAVVIAVVLYYRHFGATYRGEWERITAETAARAADAGGRTPADRLALVPYSLATYFGIAPLLLAAAGGARLYASAMRDRLTLATAGWGMACLLFMGLGIVTPVDMRYYLAAVPALAVAGAAGASWMWARGGTTRAVALLLVTWAAAAGAASIFIF